MLRPEGLHRVPLERLLIEQRDLCNESYERHDYGRDGVPAMPARRSCR